MRKSLILLLTLQIFVIIFPGTSRASTEFYIPFQNLPNNIKTLNRMQRIFSSNLTNTYRSKVLSQSPEVKSFFVSGWGQIELGEHLKGSIFAGIAFTSAAMSIYYNQRGNKSYSRYQEAEEEGEISYQRRETKGWDIRRNQAILVFIANHIINIIDILYFKNETKEGENSGKTFLEKIKITYKREGLREEYYHIGVMIKIH